MSRLVVKTAAVGINDGLGSYWRRVSWNLCFVKSYKGGKIPRREVLMWTVDGNVW